MARHDAVVLQGTKKALLCWRADSNDLRLAAHDVVGIYIAVGGAFTIDGKCSTMHEEKPPARD